MLVEPSKRNVTSEPNHWTMPQLFHKSFGSDNCMCPKGAYVLGPALYTFIAGQVKRRCLIIASSFKKGYSHKHMSSSYVYVLCDG